MNPKQAGEKERAIRERLERQSSVEGAKADLVIVLAALDEARAENRELEEALNQATNELGRLRQAVRPLVNRLFLSYEDWDEVIAVLGRTT
jgi:hypothetical protein